MWANVGLRGGVRHGVIAHPGGKVDVERSGVDDPIGIHEPLASQLKDERTQNVIVSDTNVKIIRHLMGEKCLLAFGTVKTEQWAEPAQEIRVYIGAGAVFVAERRATTTLYR